MARILLIDDDIAFAELTQRRLEKRGMRVTIHAEPSHVVPLLSSGRYDLVLLDLSMPGLAGDALLGVLKSFPSIDAPRVLLYSSADEEKLRQIANQFGAAYLSKSATTEELLSSVRMLIGSG